jgi:Uma2 family endonuclease
MAVQTKVPVEEYLSTAYKPDVDYVHGELVERNAGEKAHSELMLRLVLYLRNVLRVYAIFETRLQISHANYRVPDVCAYLEEPSEQVFTSPPFLCVEVLSPEDRVHRVEARVADYLSIHVPTVWMIDPHTRNAWIYTADHRVQVTDGVLRTASPALEVPIAALFE